MRLREYDYSQSGAYYITICSRDQGGVFGEVIDTAVRLNQLGDIVVDCMLSLPEHFSLAKVDSFIVMPNHVHCILILECNDRHVPAEAVSKGSLGQIVAYLKYQTTKRLNAVRKSPGEKLWQRNYYEHIIRNEDDLRRIRKYIENNPAKWIFDRYNPSHGSNKGWGAEFE